MKKNRKMGFWVFVVAAVLAIFACVFHWYILAILIIAAAYVVHALLFTDHIYYDPKSDYQFNFNNVVSFGGNFSKGEYSLVTPVTPDNEQDQVINTCILPVHLRSHLSGAIFDPYVEIKSGDIVSRQYFERGAEGKRFLNLSLFCDLLRIPSTRLTISSRHCEIKEDAYSLQAFENPDYCGSRVLIISPHADDAELAAFGLYKNTSSVSIVTVSAGEVDARPFEVLTGSGNGKAASLLKGVLRAWDSIAIPLWGGRHVEAIHLGHFCNTLKAMYDSPEKNIPSLSADTTTTKPFRIFNKQILPGDMEGENSWKSLVNDLTTIINNYQPDVILTPHPMLDPHSDHLYSTVATLQACEAAQATPEFLLYANHFDHTDMYPFGSEHTDVALPPHFETSAIANRLYSFPLSEADQVDKICALQMMHDLNRPTSIKKHVRRLLQRVIGRSQMPYGNDDYLRKAIRQQELFWVTSLAQLKQATQLKLGENFKPLGQLKHEAQLKTGEQLKSAQQLKLGARIKPHLQLTPVLNKQELH